MPNYTDEQLWNQVKLDDYAAFEVIYRRYATLLFNAGYAITKEKQACEDIIQEVFIRIWTSRHRLDIHTLKSYLLKSTRNEVLMYLRKRRAHISLESIENNVAAFCQIEQALSDRDDLTDIFKKIEGLPEKCKEIFILSRKHQLSNKEISERLNISVKTVENQITIAIRKLKPVTEKACFIALMMFVQIISKYI